ncbi:coagulation factor 5/8 type domain-containing protein, partial [Streptomyces sp. NPDC051642]
MPPSPADASSLGRTPLARRSVLGAMAVAAAAPGLLALSSPASAAPERALDLPGGGDLGPNVIVFDPSTAGIQARLDQIFAQQETAQFGTG